MKAKMNSPALRICLVDMNNGVTNQATRCFRRIVDAFAERVRHANPGHEVSFRHVQPRNLGELPSADDDLILSSGGPGTPFDGFDDPWCKGYRKILDGIVEANIKKREGAPKALVICHSFEIAVIHFAIARMEKRPTLKFGVMPAYILPDGQSTDFLKPFGYRLFTWEHRNWEAVGVDEARMKALGGKLLAMESHAKGVVNTGQAILGLKFAPGVHGTQFHPEADKAGVMAWIEKPEHMAAVESAYGRVLYDRMLRSLANPERLAKTFALLIPSWLTNRFNQLAAVRGLHPVGVPAIGMQDFDVAV
jgi:GMP synthase-like glutamine amidotransferase